jgi:hypothetical protein
MCLVKTCETWPMIDPHGRMHSAAIGQSVDGLFEWSSWVVSLVERDSITAREE